MKMQIHLMQNRVMEYRCCTIGHINLKAASLLTVCITEMRDKIRARLRL